MASSTTTISLHYSSPSSFKLPIKPSLLFPQTLTRTRTRTRNPLRIAASSTDMLGDYGARDPFPAEIESNFGEKVLGFMSTDHKILIPNASSLSLSQQSCSPNHPPMSADEAKQLLFKVVGWRLIEEIDEASGKMVLKLRCLWKVKDFRSGAELIGRIAKVGEEAGHFPVLHLEKNNQVRGELWSEEIGGLSLNDFIVAAKIDEVNTSDLIPRKRVWA